MSLSVTTNRSEDAQISNAVSTPGWRMVSMVLILVLARWLAHSYAGGLWRDEIHSVNMATASTDDLFYVLTQDSFPVLWQVLLRGWIGLFGSTDASVRLLGLLVGMAVIPALWWMFRQLGLSFPWWSMVLLGLDPTFIIFGGEVRGYSLGIVTLLVLIGMSWNVLSQPTAWRWAGLMVAALLAVQSSYTNCFLLAATFIGCGIVAVYRGRYLVCVGFAIIGILSALSMLPYAIYVLPRLSGVIKPFLAPISGWTRFKVFFRTILWGGAARAVICCILGVIASREVYQRVFTRQSPQPESEQNLVIFTITFFWVGTCGFWWYMNFLGAHTASWYYMPYLALLAIAIEIGMQLWMRNHRQQESWVFRLVMVASVLVCGEVGFSLPYRLTAVDLVARDLTERAREGDLILVMPWWYGIPFDRYYHGPAKWMTFPDVDHDRQHNGYRELYERVIPLPPAVAIKSELEQIESVLLAGGTVWWVGPKPELAPENELIKPISTANLKMGLNEAAYFKLWQHMAMTRMKAIGVTTSEHPVQRPRLINVLEDPPVYAIEANRSEPKLTFSE